MALELYRTEVRCFEQGQIIVRLYDRAAVTNVFVETLSFCFTRFHLIVCWFGWLNENHEQQIFLNRQMTVYLALHLIKD